MSRFAPIRLTKLDPQGLGGKYKYGFAKPTKDYVFMSQPGLSRRTVEEISSYKSEPKWMRELRLAALDIFEAKPLPAWGGDLGQIDFEAIHYYLRPTDKLVGSWSEVPKEIKDTFERIGIPEAERKVLAGVKAQYDCLTADSVVFMNMGVKKIIDIKPGENVYSLNEETGLLEKQRVAGLVYKGKRKIFKVATQGGREIKVTANHPFLNLVHYKGEGKHRGRYKKEWRYLSDLNIGDLIALTVNFPDGGKPYQLPTIEKPTTKVLSHNQYGNYKLDISRWYSNIVFPAETNEDLMWLLGFYIGDGFCGGKKEASVYTRVELAIPYKEEQLRMMVSRLVKKLFGYKLIVREQDRVILNSVLFVELIKKLGFSGTAYTKRIPEWVFSLPKSQRLAFIGGYFDADGNIRKALTHKNLVFTSVSKQLLEDLRLLAISCGLNPSHIWGFSSKQKYKGKIVERNGFRIQLSGEIEKVDSRLERKRSLFGKRKFVHRFKTAKGTAFRKHTSDNIGFAKILSIEDVGIEPVYDIEVEGFHNFVANGLIVHNSEVIYGSIHRDLAKQGVIFLGMDEGLQKYPELVKEYFGRAIPAGDNKFSALNSAVWSGGSFVYIPKNLEVTMPLQAYFRINAPRAGQFERTLIIADEGSKVHYIEGCFVVGTKVRTEEGYVPIETVKPGDRVVTHRGRLRIVYRRQKRKYAGKLYAIKFYGDSQTVLHVTEEHPFLFASRKSGRDRNKRFKLEWGKPDELKVKDYLAIPRQRGTKEKKEIVFKIKRRAKEKSGKMVWSNVSLFSTPKLFRLVGYYLAEGSVDDRGYLRFSLGEHEKELIADVKRLLMDIFPQVKKVHEIVDKKKHGVNVIVGSVEAARIFAHFGMGATKKEIPAWMLRESIKKQRELIKGYFRGDGNYYHQKNKYGDKEVFRMNTVSERLAYQIRDLLIRLGIPAFINARDRSREGRKRMFTVGVTGEHMVEFGKMVGINVAKRVQGHKRASMFGIDKNYVYVPIKRITSRSVDNIDVFNFSVREDESYLAGGVAVHNCTAPAYSAQSLHAAVVEIFIKKGARVQYTTVQNWYKTVYNLVTKRAIVAAEGEMVWTDFNMGSKLTMKYPSFVLAGKGARGETLSMALAGAGQHQDTGSKAFHLAPYTTSTIVSKSISKDGGRTSYRGMVTVSPNAKGSKSKVVCDALILDPASRSDTYPTNRILCDDVSLEHEATVSKIGEEQLFYLMSRGLSEQEASKMIVSGFVEPLVKKLPLEYAVEMNRLIDMEMQGSVG